MDNLDDSSTGSRLSESLTTFSLFSHVDCELMPGLDTKWGKIFEMDYKRFDMWQTF